jgi:hypothetical protein
MNVVRITTFIHVLMCSTDERVPYNHINTDLLYSVHVPCDHLNTDVLYSTLVPCNHFNIDVLYSVLVLYNHLNTKLLYIKSIIVLLLLSCTN